MKKLLATIMALVMALSLLPTAVWAVGDNQQTAAATPTLNAAKEWQNVTPDNVQALLDGAYGCIDDTTIVLTAGNYGQFELGRATKYTESRTTWRNGQWLEETGWTPVTDPVSTECLNDSIHFYERTIKNVKFEAAVGGNVNVAGLIMSSGHEYGKTNAPTYDYVLERPVTSTNDSYYLTQQVSGITFEGITFTGKVNIETSNAETTISGFTFKNCAFNINTKSNGNQALRYYNENDNGQVTDLVVDNCTFRDCYQGIYTGKVKNVTITNCAFDKTGHNAIAIQSGNANNVNHGSVTITTNYFVNIGDRVFRFGNVGAGTNIAINNNVMISSGDSDGELIKAESIGSNTSVDLEHNYWNGKAVSAAVKVFAAPTTKVGVIAGTFPVRNADPDYCAEGYTTKANTDGTYTVERIYSTVTFNSVNGSAVEAKSIEYGQTATEPTSPTRDGYTFDGWYTDTGYATKWNFSNYAVTKDINLYAKWNKNTPSGTTIESSTVTEITKEDGATGTQETVVEKSGSTTTTTVSEETKKTVTDSTGAATGTVETKSTAVTTETAAAKTTTTTETVTNKDTSGNVTGSTETTTRATTTAGTTTTTKVETTKDASGAVSQAVKTTKDSTNSLIAETTTTPASTEAKAEVKTETVDTAIQNTSSDKSVTLDATAAETDSAVTKTVITVPKETMPLLNTAAKDSVVKALTVETDVATLAIDNTALKTLTTQATENDKLELIVEKTNVDTATSQTSGQTTTTTTATYELTAMVNSEKVFQETNQDKNGTITVTVPWTSAPGFRQQIVCYYVADDGTRTRMGGAGYKNNTFSWDTNHFSKFEVVSETVSTSRAYINLNGSSSGTTTTTTTVKKTASANTFDAGVGVYAATAILSVTGMAWVGKKKH